MVEIDSIALAMLGACLTSIAVASGGSTADDSQTKGGTAARDTIEFCDRIQYAGIAVREPEHHVWGCSPVKDDDGKHHLFGARFRNPFKTAWRSDSHVVHYLSDTPQGPFKFVEVVYRGERGKPGQWNYFGIHNPCIKKVDGKYVLFFIANSYKGRSHRPGNQTIGMMIADSPNGPWSEPKQVLTPSPDPEHWTYQAGTDVCNPAFVKMPSGKHHLYFKASGKESGMRYGVAIAGKLEGPYIHTDSPATENEEMIEDGTAFIWNGEVCLLTTDNHGNVLKGGGAFWRSEDGLKFGPPALGYYRFDKYVSQEQYPRTHGVKGRRIKSYAKIVRPQILMENGRPAWLYAPSGACEKGRGYSDCHVFRIMTDEEVRNAGNR